MAACRSSRDFPVTRSLSPWIDAWTLSFDSLTSFCNLRPESASMPWRSTMSWRASARLVTGSFFSMQRTSMPRLLRRCARMSTICLSWNSDGAFRLTVISFSLSSNTAPVSLKSKRCESSRFAWSTAFVSSWVSSSETASKEGMAASRMSGAQGSFETGYNVRADLGAQETQDHRHEFLGVLGLEPKFAKAADDGADESGIAADGAGE